MRLTQKLLSFLHRVFDKDPGRFLALRLSYDGQMSWRVYDGVLTTTVTGGSGENLSVDLSQYSLAELANFLGVQPGYSIQYTDLSELSVLSSLVLLDGSGDIASSNGDHLYGYTNVLWSYMEAMSNELAQAESEIGEMLKQMSTRTAEGIWLDELGGYYGIPRLQGELDAQYGPRIIAEVLRPRGNNVAMEAAIKVFTGQNAKVTDVTLYGDTFPIHDAAITHDGTYLYDADAAPIYGLFDVEYGYDLLNGGDLTRFRQVIQDLINRLRDAGTHLRALSLTGSAISDTFTAPTDGDLPISLVPELSDTFTAPTESDATALAITMSDSFSAPPIDDAELTLNENYRYEGIRYYNGIITHVGIQSTTGSL